MTNKINTDSKGVALQGYDPVSYFEIIQSPPRKGDKQRSSVYEGATYYFRNEENKKTFDMNPSIYAPAYGGRCATAISEGKTAPINPKTFTITNGRLFVFYHTRRGGNTLIQWETNESGRIQHADDHRSHETVQF